MNRICQFPDFALLHPAANGTYYIEGSDSVYDNNSYVRIRTSFIHPERLLCLKNVGGTFFILWKSPTGDFVTPLTTNEVVCNTGLAAFSHFFSSFRDFSCNNDFCVGFRETNESVELVKLNFCSGEVTTREEPEWRYICVEDDGIYMSWRHILEKRSPDLERIWEVELPKDVLTSSVKSPYVTGDVVVVNAGADKKTRKDGEVIAIDRTTGEVRWRKLFFDEVDNCIGIDGRIYIAHGPEMVVLEATTGKELLRRPSGLSADKHTTLWFDGAYLYFFSADERRFLVFKQDGQTLIHDMEIPDAFAVVLMDGDFKLPIRIQGGAAIPLGAGSMDLNTSLYGILEFRPGSGGLHPPIDIEAGPRTEIEARKEEDGTESYVITMDSNDDDDLVRFGELHAKGVASTRGSQVWSGRRRRKQFNGHILLRIARKVKDEARFASLMNGAIARIHDWASVMGVKAGNRKGPIAVSWEWVEPHS